MELPSRVNLLCRHVLTHSFSWNSWLNRSHFHLKIVRHGVTVSYSFFGRAQREKWSLRLHRTHSSKAVTIKISAWSLFRFTVNSRCWLIFNTLKYTTAWATGGILFTVQDRNSFLLISCIKQPVLKNKLNSHTPETGIRASVSLWMCMNSHYLSMEKYLCLLLVFCCCYSPTQITLLSKLAASS